MTAVRLTQNVTLYIPEMPWTGQYLRWSLKIGGVMYSGKRYIPPRIRLAPESQQELYANPTFVLRGAKRKRHCSPYQGRLI